MIFRHSRILFIATALIGTALTSACSLPEAFRQQTAQRIASPAWMVERDLKFGSVELVAFERMHERGEDATIYIEGDGNAEELRTRALFNATPMNPVALHLASHDKAENVAYIARPCQYTDEFTPRAEQPFTFCGEEFWTGDEYRADVLSVYNKALDEMKARYGLKKIHLVGYASGATLAQSLAADRNDIIDIRTVAGLFDLNILGPDLDTIRYIPQHHFAGGQDKKAPPAELHKYLQAIGESDCIDYTLIQEAEHSKGWVDKWPSLLEAHVPTCAKPAAPDFMLIEQPEPVYSPRNVSDFKGK